jgi:TolB protein
MTSGGATGAQPLGDAEAGQQAVGDGLSGTGQQVGQVVRLVHVTGERCQMEDEGGQAAGDGPSWSSDGGRIAYIEWYSGAGACSTFISDVDNGEKRKVFDGGEVPQWSPDGSRIAFVKGNEVLVGDVDGGNVRRVVTTVSGAYQVTWSPDGRRLAYVADNTIFVVDVDWNGESKRLSKGEFEEELVADPTWSPDGRRIAFTIAIGSRNWEGPRNWSIYVVDVDGTEQLTRITDGSDPDWSPDGSRIVFTR